MWIYGGLCYSALPLLGSGGSQMYRSLAAQAVKRVSVASHCVAKIGPRGVCAICGYANRVRCEIRAF